MREARFECSCGASIVTDFRDVGVIDREGNVITVTLDSICETVRKYRWRRDGGAWWCPDCATTVQP